MSIRLKTEDGDIILSGKGRDGKSGIPVPQTAEVGQVLAVKAVDSESKPIEWEVVNQLGGGDVDDLIKILRLEQSELPYGFYQGSAVVLNDEIHILGGTDNGNKHYKYNGTSWESVSTLPYDFYQGSAVVLNDEIHILGSNSDNLNHYKYDGTLWKSISTLPHSFYQGSAVVLSEKCIGLLGGPGTYFEPASASSNTKKYCRTKVQIIF